MDELLQIMAKLRDKETGCPWDKAQNFQTIAPFTLEEAYEVLDAIDKQDMNELQSELGDLLLQVVFHAQIAQENGIFDFHDVVADLKAKLIRRHPHVFGNERAKNAEEVAQIWQNEKTKEKLAKNSQKTSVFADVPNNMPSLMFAEKISKKAAKLGFDWENIAQVITKLHEEINEFHQAIANNDADNIAEEIGDIMFCAVQLSRKTNNNAEIIMRQATNKFISRFTMMEKLMAQDGREYTQLTPRESEEYWQKAKKINHDK